MTQVTRGWGGGWIQPGAVRREEGGGRREACATSIYEILVAERIHAGVYRYAIGRNKARAASFGMDVEVLEVSRVDELIQGPSTLLLYANGLTRKTRANRKL